jgi:hypothetical protein
MATWLNVAWAHPNGDESLGLANADPSATYAK